MKCAKCSEKAVIDRPGRCKRHLFSYVEGSVRDTIRRYKLFSKRSKVGVACSGGKDSTALLYILKKQGYDVEALAVDEGIQGYRDKTLKDLKEFCKEHGVKLRVKSFRKRFGDDLDNFVSRSDKVPCSICGVMRRSLLNKYGKEYDVIATGHNLDDEAQSIMMNIVTGKIDILARIGPKTGMVDDDNFSNRVKPLYFVKEREILAYAFLKGFNGVFVECPYAPLSFRNLIRDELNGLESKEPGVKKNVVESFLGILPKLKILERRDEGVNRCSKCDEPAMGTVCKACILQEEVAA